MSDKLEKLRLLAVDMDGTALLPDARVTPSTLEALRRVMDEGALVIPASGRVFGGIPQEILGLGVPYAITANGASVVETATGKRVYERNIRHEDAMELLSYLLTENGQTYFQCEDRYYEDSRQARTAALIHPYMALAGLNRTGGQEDLLGFAGKQGNGIQKIGIMVFDEEAEARILAYGTGLEQFHVMKTGHFSLEFNRRGTSKGNALEHLCGLLGVEAGQVMAIGDNENDSSMLAFAGLGVAMGNAPEHVKAAADFVTKTNVEDGVAWALGRFWSQAAR